MIRDEEGKCCEKCTRRYLDCPVSCPEEDYKICYSCIHGVKNTEQQADPASSQDGLT